VLTPVEAQPAHVVLDRLDVADVLRRGVRVVEAEVAAGGGVLLCDPEVEHDRLGMPDVQKAVRFRGEARHDPPFCPACRQIAVDDLTDEVATFGRRCHRARSFRGGIGVCLDGLRAERMEPLSNVRAPRRGGKVPREGAAGVWADVAPGRHPRAALLLQGCPGPALRSSETCVRPARILWHGT
jgi:hypothetical protein